MSMDSRCLQPAARGRAGPLHVENPAESGYFDTDTPHLECGMPCPRPKVPHEGRAERAQGYEERCDTPINSAFEFCDKPVIDLFTVH
jgi:hypothetical protein